MSWYNPKKLLHRVYEAGVLIKAIDGFFQLFTGLLLVFLTPAAFHSLMVALGHGSFSVDNKTSAALFFLSHGFVKLFLAVCLLLNKMWAYPTAMVALGLFVAYQTYQFVINPHIVLAIVTLLNVGILYLIYREWQVAKNRIVEVKSED